MKKEKKWQELLIELQDGNEEAYEQIYKLYYPIVYYRALYFFCDEQRAQDAAQNVLLEVYLKIKDIRDIQAFPAWIKTTTYRKCISMVNYDRKDGLSYISDVELENQGKIQKGNDVSDIHIRDAIDLIKERLPKLKEPKRTIGILYFLEGYSAKEISELLDINVNTIFSHIYRIRQFLIKELKNNEFPIRDCLSAEGLPILTTMYQDYIVDLANVMKLDATKGKVKKLRLRNLSTTVSTKLVMAVIIFIGAVSVLGKEQGIKKIQSLLHLDNKTEILSIDYSKTITNKELQISVKTTNNRYDKILIDGKQTTVITENGIYQVAIQKGNKVIDTQQIVIDNIDKSGPYIAKKEDFEKECILVIEDNHAINYEKTKIYINGEVVEIELDKKTSSILLPKEAGVSYHIIVFDEVDNHSDFYVNFFD